jgi:hypothetical protein
MPINPLGYSCIKKLQMDNLLHAYNEPINIYSVLFSFGTFDSFLAGIVKNQVYGACYSFTQWPINQFKPDKANNRS